VRVDFSSLTELFWFHGLRPMLLDLSQWCKDCSMWLNGAVQMQEHSIGKKHKKNVRNVKADQCPRGKGILVPNGTVILLEQLALLYDIDLVWRVRRSLYATIASKLASYRAPTDCRCGIPSAI
jgi:hypothetical protein